MHIASPVRSGRRTPANPLRSHISSTASSRAVSRATSRASSRAASPTCASRRPPIATPVPGSARTASPRKDAPAKRQALPREVCRVAAAVVVAPPVEEKVPKPPIDLSLECIDTEEEEITLESDSEDPTYVVLHWDAFDTAIGSLCICCRWWPSGQQAGEDGAQSEEVLELAADLQVDDMINDRGQAPILLWDDRESVAFDWTPPVALPERNSGSQADLGRCSVVSNFEKGPRPGAWSLRLAWHCGKPEDRRDIPRAIQATVQLGLLGGRSRWMTAGSLRSRQHVGGSKCFDIPLRESLEAQSGSPQQQRIRETRRDIAGLRVRRRRSERRVEHDARLIEKCSAELKGVPK